MAAPLIRIGIIGAGRLGTSLAAALAGAGYRLAAVSRTGEMQRNPNFGPDTVVTTSATEVVKLCDAVFLTVPDGAIRRLGEGLPWRAGQWAIHCSGALGIEVLTSAATAGATTGTFHPLQSFPSREPEPDRFRGIVCGVEGEGDLGQFLDGAARALGARPVRLEGVDRALYHAAAVMVNNHAVALAAGAARLWEAAGLPATEARAALEPLLAAAAQNVASRELARALTGPLARGDLETIKGHLAALTPYPDLRELYRRLSQELLRLPLGHNAEKLAALERELEATDP